MGPGDGLGMLGGHLRDSPVSQAVETVHPRVAPRHRASLAFQEETAVFRATSGCPAPDAASWVQALGWPLQTHRRSL